MTELHGMLKGAEESIKKSYNHVMMVQKTTSFKKKGKSGKGKGKGKTQDEIESLKAKLKKLKLGPKPNTECYHCHEQPIRYQIPKNM